LTGGAFTRLWVTGAEAWRVKVEEVAAPRLQNSHRSLSVVYFYSGYSARAEGAGFL